MAGVKPMAWYFAKLSAVQLFLPTQMSLSSSALNCRKRFLSSSSGRTRVSGEKTVVLPTGAT